jgi:predicted DNA-binding transcriptional regulator AlpA
MVQKKADLPEHDLADRLYTTPEACKFAGIGPTLFYKWKKMGRGPREIRLGTAVRYSKQALLDWVLRLEEYTAQLNTEERLKRSRMASEKAKKGTASPKHPCNRKKRSADVEGSRV